MDIVFFYYESPIQSFSLSLTTSCGVRSCCKMIVSFWILISLCLSSFGALASDMLASEPEPEPEPLDLSQLFQEDDDYQECQRDIYPAQEVLAFQGMMSGLQKRMFKPTLDAHQQDLEDANTDVQTLPEQRREKEHPYWKNLFYHLQASRDKEQEVHHSEGHSGRLLEPARRPSPHQDSDIGPARTQSSLGHGKPPLPFPPSMKKGPRKESGFHKGGPTSTAEYVLKLRQVNIWPFDCPRVIPAYLIFNLRHNLIS